MSATTKRKPSPLTEEDWIAAGRGLLIDEGIKGLSLRRLAATLGVTTGAFYWLFGNFEDYLDTLRADWNTRNNLHFIQVFETSDLTSAEKYIEYLRILLDPSRFDPIYDSAVRDWAAFSTETAQLVAQVDARRLRQLETMYEGFGSEGLAARVRAELAYFHQLGYYLAGKPETLEERLAKLPYYAQMVCPDIIPLDISMPALKELLKVDRQGTP